VSENALEERLRDAFGGRPAPRPACGADPQAIWRAIQGEAGERETRDLLAHAVHCADCDLAWRLGRELGAALGPAPQRPAEIVHLRRWTAVGAIALAAAAAVLLLPVFPRQRAPGPSFREEPAESVSSLVPQGPLRRDRFLLRWAALAPGTLYSLSVARPDLTQLYSANGIEASEHQVPAQALAGVPAGGEVLWRVEARLPDGRRLSSRAFSARVE